MQPHRAGRAASGAQRFATLLLLVSTLAAIALGIELVLPHFVPVPHIAYHFWGDRPYTFLPGVEHRARTQNFDVTFRANALGFNDLDHDPERPAGPLRVLLLGDSFVAGIQVAPELHLARLLEARAAREGHALEVVSMGISGYGLSHELATYEAVGRRYRPDLVLHFFCMNDLWNNLVLVDSDARLPPYILDADGALVSTLAGKPELPPTPEELRRQAWKTRYPGLRALRFLFKRSFQLLTAAPDVKRAARAAALYELPDEVADQEGDPGGPPGIRLDQRVLYDKLVAELKRAVVDREGHRLLCVFATANVRRKLGVSYNRLVPWVAETFARQGVECLDLDTPLRERAQREQRFPNWETDAHWNATGHGWVADLVYPQLEPLLAPSRAAP